MPKSFFSPGDTDEAEIQSPALITTFEIHTHASERKVIFPLEVSHPFTSLSKGSNKDSASSSLRAHSPLGTAHPFKLSAEVLKLVPENNSENISPIKTFFERLLVYKFRNRKLGSERKPRKNKCFYYI